MNPSSSVYKYILFPFLWALSHSGAVLQLLLLLLLCGLLSAWLLTCSGLPWPWKHLQKVAAEGLQLRNRKKVSNRSWVWWIFDNTTQGFDMPSFTLGKLHLFKWQGSSSPISFTTNFWKKGSGWVILLLSFTLQHLDGLLKLRFLCLYPKLLIKSVLGLRILLLTSSQGTLMTFSRNTARTTAPEPSCWHPKNVQTCRKIL